MDQELSHDHLRSNIVGVRRNGGREWRPFEVEIILIRAASGESYSSIAGSYGTTRGAIAGLIKREKDKRKKHHPFNPSFAGKPSADKPVKRVRLKLLDNPAYVTFAELQSHHCKWPFGDPKQPDFRFCGCTRVEGKPYCAAHVITAGKLYERKGNE